MIGNPEFADQPIGNSVEQTLADDAAARPWGEWATCPRCDYQVHNSANGWRVHERDHEAGLLLNPGVSCRLPYPRL